MKTTNLQFMPYAQAIVITNENTKILRSYETNVIIIDTASGWVQCSGTYSNTTRRHIGAFCKEVGCGLTYQLMKRIFTNKEKFNIYTGEIIAL